ncbi:uncharacterized protein A1O9_06016 [Exophiala aquamarina CBS 119918]|uniref:BZIP domain-containing protein n=1 Tax=Exophiala aquamarina CBS 119918 TaxID=1182545 RepID=A0A072PFN7_9EURO|nr:uncharacterized protein A1O9_06016 [Exophiala aquamarina CBS 119918]KEF58093.1 hypothetical protein A1O9_06016 [Exophiala aquamarina CBS 119918]
MVSRRSRSSTPSGERWASGRNLTSAQRERKRAVDRQRASKRRVQAAAHVASLESRLEELCKELETLKRSRPSPTPLPPYDIPLSCHGPLSVHNNEAAENGPVSGTLNNIDSKPDPLSTLDSSDWMPVDQSTRQDDTTTQIGVLSPKSLSIPSWPSGMISGQITESRSEHITEINRDITEEWIDTAPYSTTRYRSDPTSAGNCQSIFNNVLTTAHFLSRTSVCTDPSLNQDALIRGILFGWDNIITTSPFFCPLWEILRHLDKRIFQLSGTITRLCTLRMIHSLLLCLMKANSFGSLPAWYRPRPSQYRFPHPLAADVLPWPGLRERAVLCHGLTQSNKFWTEVIYYFRFCWPYTVDDIVSLDSATGLYGFSKVYDHYVYEIRMWKMDMNFFVSFPETYDDIVPAPDIEWPIQSANMISGSLESWDARSGPRPLPLPEELDENSGD